MTIRVMYHDGTYDMISAFTLDQFIRTDKIKEFFRYSEDKWVRIGVDPVRNQTAEQRYQGSERRLSEVIAHQLV